MYKLAVLNTHPIQYLAPLYRRLAQEPDIDLTVYFCSRQGSEEYLDVGFGERVKWDISLLDGYQYKFLKNLRAPDHVGGFWSLINPEIVRELRENRYDALLVSGHNHATYLLAICAARVFGIPVLMRCETHLLLQRSLLKRALRKPLMSFLYNYLCTACLPIGTRNREFYRFHGVSEARLVLVPYAVDNRYFTEATQRCRRDANTKAKFGLPESKPVVLFASKLMSRKRPMDLLLAFQQVRRDGIDAALAIVGSGQEEQALRHYVEAQCLPDVFFFGFRNQSELPKFYSIADVFVFPSENEPWGLVLNEVMCAGLPIIASKDIGAVPDLVRDGENGFTFAAGDITQLSNHLCHLLDRPELRRRMGEESRQIIALWDYERCVLGLKQILAQIEPNHDKATERKVA